MPKLSPKMDKHDLKLQPLQVHQLPELQELSIRTFVDAFAEANTKKDMEIYLSEAFSGQQLKAEWEDADATFYLLRAEGQTLGYCKIKYGLPSAVEESGSALEICRLYVSQNYQGQRLGQWMLGQILKKAQDEFFKEQKELLDASTLSDEQYNKSLELSSRALTEYILFRQLTIEKLKKSTDLNSEAELHKLFASMRKEGRFDKDNSIDDLYRNNAWLLDDKYMTYETILSDREMGELVEVITDDEELPDDNRPDIALIFSNNPENKKPFDVVIVELKKRGISLEENMKVVTQLEKRARKLMNHYNNQIQRIWFYGIIEFNKDVEMQLAGEYTELYSSGKMYYRETNIAISLNPKVILPIGVFIWDLDAVINDADARNSAFLNLIKSKFQ